MITNYGSNPTQRHRNEKHEVSEGQNYHQLVFDIYVMIK